MLSIGKVVSAMAFPFYTNSCRPVDGGTFTFTLTISMVSVGRPYHRHIERTEHVNSKVDHVCSDLEREMPVKGLRWDGVFSECCPRQYFPFGFGDFKLESNLSRMMVIFSMNGKSSSGPN